MAETAEDECVRIDTRLAGQILRYHTWPILKQQTVAEHCWQLIRIYLAVVDVPDPHMVMHMMFHDIGEHAVGDLPYPIKHDNPKLKEQIEMLEHRSYAAQLDYWNSFHQIRLNDEEKIFFKQIELVEMAEFGMDQVSLGNSLGFIIANRCLRSVYEQVPNQRLCQYIQKRIHLFKKQCRLFYEYQVGDEWWRETKWETLHVSKSEADRRKSLQDDV